jgi:hypothetical protein
MTIGVRRALRRLGLTAVVVAFMAFVFVDPASACGLQCQAQRYQQYMQAVHNIYISLSRAMAIVASWR